MSEVVRVHSCHAEIDPESHSVIIEKKNVKEGRKYYSDDPQFEFFRALPAKCNCKKMVTVEQSKEYIEKGKAFRVYKPKNSQPLDSKWEAPHECVDESQIVMPVDRSQTPRVDLITKADMERAYVDGQEKYINHIEEVHLMIMEERAKLIVPFQPDPQEGRILFPFGPDQRTVGGHQ